MSDLALFAGCIQTFDLDSFGSCIQTFDLDSYAGHNQRVEEEEIYQGRSENQAESRRKNNWGVVNIRGV